MFKNDLPYVVNKSSVVIYADDSTMFYSTNDYIELTTSIALDCAGTNNMISNTSKLIVIDMLQLANSPE